MMLLKAVHCLPPPRVCQGRLPAFRNCSSVPLGRLLITLVFCLAGTVCEENGLGADYYSRQGDWAETVLKARKELLAAGLPDRERLEAASRTWLLVKEDFPVQWDWLLQDGGQDHAPTAALQPPGDPAVPAAACR